MTTRRTFLQTLAATTLGAVAGGGVLRGTPNSGPLPVREARIVRVRPPTGGKAGATDTYLEITSESGLRGYAGPLLKDQVAAFPANMSDLVRGRDAAPHDGLNFHTLWAACEPGRALARYAEGKDPRTGASVRGLTRALRHTETGWLITALSAMDLALWDLRGKAAGQPVWRLLGGQRPRLKAYASMLGHSVVPAEARHIARTYFDQGFHRQKWFFSHGLADGAAGLKENIALAYALREELGPDAILMFDGIQYVWKQSVDVDYAIALAKGILPCRPHWLEEPLRPDDLEGYTRLKGETGITLASGEHWYTRWNAKPFLDRGIVSFVQSDTEWCGGLTEWLQICALVRTYPGVQVVPHGHHVLAAAAGVASQSEALCPMLEYLMKSRVTFQRSQTRALVATAGTFALPEEPGLGPSPDPARIERS